MTFREAAEETIKTAKTSGRLCYLYQDNAGFFVSHEYWKDWLLQVYPGGRKVLSRRGKEMAEANDLC